MITGRTAIIFHRLGPYHVARLAAANKELAVSCIELAGKTQEYAWDRVESEGSFDRITLFPESDIRLLPRTMVAEKLDSLLRQRRFAAMAIPGWSEHTSLAALSYCLSTQTPAILMSESTEFDTRRSRLKEWVKRLVISLFSAALVGGRPHADYLNKLGMPPQRVFTGYDSVDNDHFSSSAKAARADSFRLRNLHRLPEKHFLASARFIEKKNLLRLIEAYAKYRADEKVSPVSPGGGSWKLVLLGSGPLQGELTSLVEGLSLAGEVTMPGFKQYHELPVYYGLASAFIHASTSEQWGLVVNEALASGLPVLVSNKCGCATELVHAGVNGFTFDPLDTEELAGLMRRLATLPAAQLSAMGAASERIIDDWGPGRFATGMEAAVRCAIAAPKPRRTLAKTFLLRALMRR